MLSASCSPPISRTVSRSADFETGIGIGTPPTRAVEPNDPGRFAEPHFSLKPRREHDWERWPPRFCRPAQPLRTESFQRGCGRPLTVKTSCLMLGPSVRGTVHSRITWRTSHAHRIRLPYAARGDRAGLDGTAFQLRKPSVAGADGN